MKKLPLLALSAAFVLVVAGCDTNPSSPAASTPNPTSVTNPTSVVNPSTNPTPSSSSVGIVVTKVTIEGADETTVLAGSTVTLRATVEGNTGNLRVNWSTSDEAVARVTNGVVKFGDVKSESKVTITATSRDDATKSASVEFTVKYCPINLSNSRGSIDSSMYLIDGSLIVSEPQDSALMFDGVYGTKWYVEAEFMLTDFLESDQYPKVGIMTGTSEQGYWNVPTETTDMKNYFYYMDVNKGGLSSGWTAFNMVPQIEDHKDWNWGGQKGGFSVSASDKVDMVNSYRIGLMRNGQDFFLYTQTTIDGEVSMIARKQVTYTDIAADEATYAWLGGWATAYSVSNFRSVTDSATIDAMYGDPSSIRLNFDAQALGLGETCQLSVSSDTIVWRPSQITWSSSDETVATVDTNGKVTASETKQGNAIITATYSDNVKATCNITVANLNTIWDKQAASPEFSYAHEIDENPYIEIAANPSIGGVMKQVPLKDVNTTKFYAEMTVEMSQGEDPTEKFAKYGLGTYTLNSTGDVNNLIWYAQDATVNSGSRPLTMGQFTMKNGEWNWGSQGGDTYFDAPETLNKFNDVTYTFGMLRNGSNYYYFRDGNLIWKTTDKTEVFGEETNSRVGFITMGGIGAKISNTSCITGEEVDTMFAGLANDVAVEGTHWIKNGQVEVKDDATLKFGKNLNGGGVKEGVNSALYSEKLNSGFTIEMDVKNYASSSAGWYFPKLDITVRNKVGEKYEDQRLCYAYRLGDGGADSFARFETCLYGNWQNSPNFSDPMTFDATATHHIKIVVAADGTLSMFFDGTQMALEGENLTRNIGAVNDASLRINACFAAFEIENFTLTVE